MKRRLKNANIADARDAIETLASASLLQLT
jgi:hypothetical protein